MPVEVAATAAHAGVLGDLAVRAAEEKSLPDQDRLFLGKIEHRPADPFIALLGFHDIVRRFRLRRLQCRVILIEQRRFVAPERIDAPRAD